MRIYFILSLLPAAALCLSGCATHLDETRQMRSYWESGDYKAAALSAAEMAEGAEDSADELVWLLDEGSASRAAGQISQSIKAFDKAYDLVQKFDSEPEINLAAESKALLTNLSYLPYTGYNYDRIMLGTYQALNCMETGDIDGAAVMLKRVENFQRDAERKNAERISYGMESAARTSGSTVDGKRVYDANRAMSDVRFQNALAGVYGSGASVFKGSRGNYVNPFAYWLDGVYFMACAKDSADRQRSVDSFRILSSMVENKYVAEDLRQAGKVADGEKMPATTYVIYETGCAPLRDQVRIDIPVFLATNDVPYVGVNFPRLRYVGKYSPNLSVSAGGKSYPPLTVADMDKIVAEEFNNELPLVIAKTLLSAGTKAALQYGLQESVRAASNGDSALLLAAMIVGSIYQVSMNDADLRTWSTLPKQIKISRMPTPKDGKIFIDGREVKVDVSARANIVCVNKPSAFSQISIRCFAIGKH